MLNSLSNNYYMYLLHHTLHLHSMLQIVSKKVKKFIQSYIREAVEMLETDEKLLTPISLVAVTRKE